MKRKLLKLATVGMIVMTVFGACKREEKENKIKWKIDNGTLIISGKGEIEATIRDVITRQLTSANPWDKYSESIHTIVIEDGITSIGYFAFESYKNLTSVTIPSTITSIWDYAFSQCYRLKTVNYNAINCTTMYGHDVFWNDTSFTTLNIGNQVKTIPEKAFSFCGYLTSVTIPNSVTNLGEGAFGYCSRLSSISIPNSVTTIGENAFYLCKSLTSIVIPNSVVSLGGGAFGECTNLVSITLSNSIKTINDLLFWSCENLTSISIPNSVTSIGDNAFDNCRSLNSIIIPDNVTTIGEYAFSNCLNLNSIIIPEGLRRIGKYAFAGCRKLTSITNFNPNPIDLDFTIFHVVDKSSCTLKVPTTSVSAYQNAYEWKEFNIVGI